MPQLSKRTFNEVNRYEAVIFQEGTHPADFEMVEAQDIQSSERRALIQNLLTDGAIGNGFLVVGSDLTNAVNVTPGTILSQGRRLLLPDGLHQTIGGQYVYNMPVAVPTAPRTDLVYLAITVNKVTSTQDPNIEDPALGPGAYREQVAYAISLAQGTTTVPSLPQGQTGFPLAQIRRYTGVSTVAASDVIDVRPISRISNQFSPSNLVVVSQVGGQFNSVQAALDSIPVSGPNAVSQTNQYIVLVEPGTYGNSVPITLTKPFVTVTGFDPATTTVRVAQSSGSAFTVSASNAAISNLGIDVAALTVNSNTIVSVGAGLSSVTISNCLIGHRSFAESLATAPSIALGIIGVQVGSGSSVSISGSLIWGGNFTGATSGSGLSNSSATVSLIGTKVTAFSTGATSGTGAVVNNGTMLATGCTVTSNDRSLYSSGPFSAVDTTFTVAPINSVAGTAADCMSLSGSTVALTDCILKSTIDQIVVSGASLNASGTSIGAYVSISGSSTSKFFDCEVTTVTMSGGSVSAEFLSCNILGGSGDVADVPIGNNSTNLGLVVKSGASCRISSCTNGGGNAVVANGANPVVSNCTFNSVGTVDVIDVTNSANPLILDTTFVLGPGSSSRAVNILDTASNPTVSGCFFQAPASLPPTVFVDGISGSRLQYGINTPSLGINLYSTNITLVALESGFVTFPALASNTASGGASLVGIQPVVGSVPTNFQITATTVQGAIGQVEDALNASLNSSGFIPETGLDQLRPYASSTPNALLNVSPGPYITSNGSGKVEYFGGATAFSSVPFSAPQQSRIDLAYLTDAGILSVLTGTASLTPAPPPYPIPGLVLAEVTCTYNGGSPPILNQINVKDVRPFLRSETAVLTAAGGDLSGTYPNPSVVAIKGVGVSSTPPTTNQVLTATSPTAAQWAIPLISPSVQNDVTGSRTMGTVFLNNSAKVMFVAVEASGGINTGNFIAYTDSSTNPTTRVGAFGYSGINGIIQGENSALFFVVLPGNYYKIVTSGMSLIAWIEWT